MAKITGLGRGLSSLIPKKVPENILSDKNKDILVAVDGDRILQVPVDSVEINPHQPRKSFGHAELEELIESIKVHGIIQPLIVTRVEGGYQLIAGERRLRSAKVIGLETVPVIVRKAEEQEKFELALIENVQRKDLNVLEKAIAYQRLIDEFGMSQEEVGQKLGISRSSVANTIRMLFLAKSVQDAIIEGKITEGHAKVLAGLEEEKEQLALLKKILQNDYTVRQTEERKPVRKGKVTRRKVLVAEIQAWQDDLQTALATKVEIKGNLEQGEINIKYFSEEELQAIVNKITEEKD
ncbi:ParB/RepB/Spo0J family partition protein [Candidatus Kuenenbacteria bacterium]|nr:ParB/RepB/Spo0J family partition protein [Candidatus Kuenenbacteria bacterium]